MNLLKIIQMTFKEICNKMITPLGESLSGIKGLITLELHL